MLDIKNLQVNVEGKQILKGITLHVNADEVHAIMGPNGSGKSTLARALAGHPQYEITGGEARFDGKDLLDLDPDERAREGVFMAFQYAVQIRGVNAMRGPDRAIIVVTHYQRLLDYIVPDYVHVLSGGRIVKSGGKELALELEKKGYGWIETGVQPVGA